MKITDPITSIDIKTETLSSHDTAARTNGATPLALFLLILCHSRLDKVCSSSSWDFVNFDFTFQKLQTAHLQIPHVKKKFPVY
jgi:hypothetical protein